MSIKFAGAPSEESSPFTEENKRICENWGELVTNYRGSVRAKYNAWAYVFAGKFRSNGLWRIRVEKSTHTAMKNIGKPKNSTVVETFWLEASHLATFQTQVIIRKRILLLDLWRRKDNFKRLNKKYVLLGKQRNSNNIQQVFRSLSEVMNNESLNRFEIKNQKLKLVIYANNTCYQLVSKIVSALS